MTCSAVSEYQVLDRISALLLEYIPPGIYGIAANAYELSPSGIANSYSFFPTENKGKSREKAYSEIYADDAALDSI